MGIKTIAGASALLLTLPFPLLANDIYVGAKAGWVHGHNACESQRLTCDNDALGAGIFAGYELNDWLALEAGYNYFGSMKADYPALGHSDVTAPYTGKVQGIELGAKPYWDLNESTSLFAKVGTLAWWTDVTGEEVGYQHSASDNGWSPMLGAGLEMAMTDNLSARVEYQWFHNVGGSATGGSSINMLSAGVAYHFGSKAAAPVVVAPVAAQVEPEKVEAMTLQLSEVAGGVLFEFNSATLTPAMVDALQPALTRLQDYRQALLTIQAHTDSRGSQAYNQKLSERRAVSVNNYFVDKGIAASRLTLDAKGETMPIADNRTDAGRAQNRRVTLTSPAFSAKQSVATEGTDK
ncbi:OmpA family protein [Aeromonas rivuli]|uniref:OmpA family protein n=1 Tax=Aeromonas rivuli TaxID=648794 RepID=UPI0005AA8CE6|nr:OmpA family protein [Aeromonas rivuli]